MPVLYRDQVNGPCLGCDCAGTGQCGGCEAADLGINLPNLVKGALTAVGLRDPLNQYEPGIPEGQVFAKYSQMISAYQARVPLLRSDTRKKALGGTLAALVSERDGLARVYASAGAVGGAKDRSRLASLVQETRNFRRDLWAAEKAVGTNAPPAASEEAMARVGGGSGGVLAMLGIAAIATFIGIRASR